MDATPEPTKNKEKFIYFLRKFLRRKNREINVYLREIFSSCVFYDFPYYLNTEQIHFDELFLLFPKEKRKKQFNGKKLLFWFFTCFVSALQNKAFMSLPQDSNVRQNPIG